MPLTSLLISSCLSGAERAVALIMVEVWLSVSFFIQRCPATMLQTFMEDTRQDSTSAKSNPIYFCKCESLENTSYDVHVSYLKGQIGVLLFLPHLEAGQVGVFELQAVLLFEILGNGALHSLSILELQRKSAEMCRK